jgi:hypothetical protein|tara:strand:+ start:55 stop:537 length:483 start_codon:yes stop_codon:yes gene_type:complete
MKVTEAQRLIKDVLVQMGQKYSKDEAVELVLVTGMVESGYKYIYQISGPARSYWQIEPDTCVSQIENYISYRKKLVKKCAEISKLDESIWTNTDKDLWDWILSTNLAAAIIHCRLKYWRVPKSLPQDTLGQAQYWKDYYNTAEGAGTVDKWLEVVEKHLV